MSLARLFPDADYRHHLSVQRGDLPAFFALQSDHADVIAERNRWLDDSPENYAAAFDSAIPAIAEAASVISHLRMPLTDNALEAVVQLGRTVEPDILLLEKNNEDAFSVVAGCVCFPSSWSFPEKLGMPLHAIHTAVPDLNSAIGAPIARFLGKMQPGASWERSNWGLTSLPDRNQHPARAIPRLTPPITLDRTWLRVEDQILSILPDTKALLFGIRIVTLPLNILCAREPDAAGGLQRALATMTDEMARYKNLGAVRADLVALLS